MKCLLVNNYDLFFKKFRYFILREKPVQLQIKKIDNVENEQETLPEDEQELNVISI